MGYSLDYIRNYMDELDNITGFNSKDIKLKTSNKMTSCYAYNQMKWDKPDDEENKVLLNNKMVYSEAILNCGASEEQIKEIIRHEYCHAWADWGKHTSSGHKGRFLECCKILGCSALSVNLDKKLDTLHDNYLLNKLKDKNEQSKFNYGKVFDKLTTAVKYKGENHILVKGLVGKNVVQVNLTITEKYPGCFDLKYLFDNTVSDIESILKSDKNILLNGEFSFTTIDSCRKAYISYSHFNIV